MPISVTMPVIWVVRTSALESLVMIAFCRPMMKHSRTTVSGTKNPGTNISLAPRMPNSSNSAASSASGSAYWLCSRRRREKLIISVEHIAPRMNESSAPKPASARSVAPRARLSAIAETIPVMCEVYC